MDLGSGLKNGLRVLIRSVWLLPTFFAASVALAIPDLPEIPKTWHREFIQDPAFKSPVLVVQSGMQNANTLVFVHGLGTNGIKDWIDVMLRLEKDYHVVALDLPGFGYSPAGEGRYSPTRYALLVRDVIARYKKSVPVVIGHSLGGAVTLRLASLSPATLSQAIIVDAAGILERTAFLKHNTAIPKGDTDKPRVVQHLINAADQVRNTVIEETGFVPDPLRARGEASQWLLSDSPNANAAFALVSEDFSDAVYNTSVPVSVVWGSADPVAPLRTGKILARRLPQARLHIIEGAGHVPMQTHLDPFISILRESIANPPEYVSATGEPIPASDREVICKDQRNVQYEGAYRHITLQNCSQVTLKGVFAEKITIEKSSVFMEDVTISGSDVGMNVVGSTVEATNMDITARRGMYLHASKLDLAGVNIVAEQVAIEAERGSRLILSISRIRSSIYRGLAHGAFKIKRSSLDRKLANTAR